MGKPQVTTFSTPKSSLAGRRPYWTAEEDEQLVRLVKKYGTKNWGIIAKELQSPIQRKGKSCRSRWKHQLNPDIKHEPFSIDEERILIAKQREFGNKWSKIVAFLPGRTDNAIKNHWHGHVKRRLNAQLLSSDEEDEMKESFPVPLIRKTTSRFTQEIECARILLQLADTSIPTSTTWVKHKCVDEGESESSKEPNNLYNHDAPSARKRSVEEYQQQHRREENNNIGAETMIQPDQQKILSDMLASAGLAHYAILPLCPIKEEDINSEQHMVLVLQQNEEPNVEMEESVSDSYLDSPASYLEAAYPMECEAISSTTRHNYEKTSALPPSSRTSIIRPKREIKKPVRFLQKYDEAPSNHF